MSLFHGDLLNRRAGGGRHAYYRNAAVYAVKRHCRAAVGHALALEQLAANSVNPYGPQAGRRRYNHLALGNGVNRHVAVSVACHLAKPCEAPLTLSVMPSVIGVSVFSSAS